MLNAFWSVTIEHMTKHEKNLSATCSWTWVIKHHLILEDTKTPPQNKARKRRKKCDRKNYEIERKYKYEKIFLSRWFFFLTFPSSYKSLSSKRKRWRQEVLRYIMFSSCWDLYLARTAFYCNLMRLKLNFCPTRNSFFFL
jgi:hypothetical protein